MTPERTPWSTADKRWGSAIALFVAAVVGFCLWVGIPLAIVFLRGWSS